MKLLSIGEILWDVIRGNEYLGGAPLNFAAHAAKLGHDCWLLSAVGDDERGRRALAAAEALHVSTRYLATSLQAETGTALFSAEGEVEPHWIIERPAAYDFLEPDDELLADSFDAICYGTLLQYFEPARRATLRVLENFPKSVRFYDVNLRPGYGDLALVRQLMDHATIVKLNEQEAATIAGLESCSLREFCETEARLFQLEAIAVTRGENGCAVLIGNDYAAVPGFPVSIADTVGAGDAFGAAFLHGVSQGWSAVRVGDFANRLGALVASRPGAIPPWTSADLNAFSAP